MPWLNKMIANFSDDVGRRRKDRIKKKKEMQLLRVCVCKTVFFSQGGEYRCELKGTYEADLTKFLKKKCYYNNNGSKY